MSRPALRAGLGTRVTVLFAAGALVLSAALAAATYQLTRSSLVQERERSAVRSAYFDAAVIQTGLSVPDPDLVEVLRRLDTGTARRPVIRRDGQWYARAADDGLVRAIPSTLQRMAASDRAGVQRVRLPGGPALVVAVPLPDVRATYFEVNDQQELQRTLRSLAVILTLVAVGTSAAGAALGAWASRRVLRPLASVTAAATSITAGDLDARLDPAREPDLARLAASFNTMVDELQARLERDRRFAADVSHELRSPLQTLSAAAAVLDRRRDGLDPRSAAAVGLLTGELERFSQLVTDLLELARGDRAVERAPVDVAELLDATCLPRGLVPEVDRPLVAEVDQRRLRQVLANLLDNADRHGGGPVAVRAGRSGDEVWLEVDDEGPGVPLDERELIFGRFGRGRTAGVRASGDGTGLGLALVAQHVAAHGGRVDVLDRPGGGARFRVEVPG